MPQVVPYHSDEEANCRQEVENIQVETCVPGFDIKCEETEVTNSKVIICLETLRLKPRHEKNWFLAFALLFQVTYKKECRTITDVLCGDQEQPEVEEDKEPETEETAPEVTEDASAPAITAGKRCPTEQG